MVVFDELRVTNDASAIIINARVRPLYKQSDEDNKCDYTDLFADVLITRVYLLNEDDILNEGGCDISVSTLASKYTNRLVYCPPDGESGVKQISEMVTDIANINPDPNKPNEFYISISGHIWFVYVVTNIEEVEITSVDLATASCDLKKNPQLGITMDMGNIYGDFMANMKELSQTCTIPENLIDLFLKYKAMMVAFDCGHCIEGINYFNAYFKNTSYPRSMPTSSCGCNG